MCFFYVFFLMLVIFGGIYEKGVLSNVLVNFFVGVLVGCISLVFVYLFDIVYICIVVDIGSGIVC